MKKLLLLLLLINPAYAADNVKTEIWCVEGYKFLYVEKTTNETFQFFQITKNGGVAVKVIECDGTEDKKVYGKSVH